MPRVDPVVWHEPGGLFSTFPFSPAIDFRGAIEAPHQAFRPIEWLSGLHGIMTES
jgi:hypothetical protein